ncbi:MAG: aminotransferase class V-fold PLP-dependent enzyme [Gammaproteobacteria bacterium]|nr:aminotransferase class V-fold PLP-dependent enzyme [Gammaproteobacteria bacterium]
MNDIASKFHRPNGAYFLTHSIGLMPTITEDELNSSFLQHWQTADEHTWPAWLNTINDFNKELATLFNSRSELFCPQTNVSSGLSKLLQSLPGRNGKDVIIATEWDFPSAGFVLKQAERLGYSVRLIPKERDLQLRETWEDYLDEDVQCVFITQVVYSSNALTPVEQICDIARKKQIFSIVDIAQAAGIVPIDLSITKADMVVGSCIKWLCGGPGAGFLWVTDNLISQLEPFDVGWFSHKNPFEFDIQNFEYHDFASRFWGGTPSVIPYAIAASSLKLINSKGLQQIQRHNHQLSGLIQDSVPPECISSPYDFNQKGGTLVIDFTKLGESNKARVEQELKRNNIHFDGRELGFRFSPHIYNTEEEAANLTSCFSKLFK